MEPTILKSRIKNITEESLFLRWLGAGGQHLKAGEEVVVHGAYPTAAKAQLMSSCLYDIDNDRVKLTLITNIPTETATAADKNIPAIHRTGAVLHTAPTAGTSAPVTPNQEETPKKEDERWGTGTIESQKPDPITLPGHEDAIGMDAIQRGVEPPEGSNVPKTLEIFPEGTTVTDDKAQAQQANDESDTERKATSQVGGDEAPAATAPAETAESAEAASEPAKDEVSSDKKKPTRRGGRKKANTAKK